MDITPDQSGGNLVNADDPRVIEIWNLVFIQYNRQRDGSLKDLAAKHIDTGMGFERVTALLNQATSNYDTDLFMPLIEQVSEITGKGYDFDNGMAHRVLSDHIRCLTFAISDGTLPSNEGRGYVLRRILRRAARFGRQLGIQEPFFYKLVPTLVAIMSEAFSELKEKQEYVSRVIKAEEESFNQTLDRGLEIFEGIVTTVKDSKKDEIPGEDTFRLYDTYGFPLDLTQLMARERHLTVDEAGFDIAMEKQRQRAKEAGKWNFSAELTPEAWRVLTNGDGSRFVGYNDFELDTKIRRIDQTEDQVFLTLADTPFYAESGGQVGDKGWLKETVLRLK